MSGEIIDPLSEGRGIDVGRIEVTSEPFQLFGVILIVWISERIQEVAVSPRATDILGRTASDHLHQARVGESGHGIEDACYADSMFPAVDEVVEVFERFHADILQDVDKPGFPGIERPVAEVRIRYAPANVACPDLVEVAVRPPHRGLKHQVQTIQADRQRHLNPPQDNGFDVIESDSELDNTGGSHVARLHASWATDQCHGSNSLSRWGLMSWRIPLAKTYGAARLGHSEKGPVSYLVPSDKSVHEALKEVLTATVNAFEPVDDDWANYELSEKHSPTESLRADLESSAMDAIKALFAEEGWEVNTGALADPSRLVYYFGVFRDGRKRKLLGVRQATQFKGAFKARFLSIADDTLRMIPDRIFKLDHQFDFLITASHVYVLHPAGFERVAEVEEYASAKAREMTVALGDKIRFLDFSTSADYVSMHKRAARLVADLYARGDLHSVRRSMFCRAAEESGVVLRKVGRKLTPDTGSELACLELLDYRRYTIALAPGRKRAFVAGSRRQVRFETAGPLARGPRNRNR